MPKLPCDESYLGNFDLPEEAAMAYLNHLRKEHPEQPEGDDQLEEEGGWDGGTINWRRNRGLGGLGEKAEEEQHPQEQKHLIRSDRANNTTGYKRVCLQGHGRYLAR